MGLKGKVLYIGGFELPDKNAAAQRVLGIVRLFKTLGYDVKLLGYSKQQVDVNNSTYDRTYDIVYNQLNYPKGVKSWIKNLLDYRTIYGFIEKESPSIIVLYNYPSFLTFKILKYAKDRNIKVLSDVTEWYEGGDGSFFKKVIKKIDVYIRMKYLLYRMDGLIVISKYLQDVYRAKVNTVLIPPIFDLHSNKFKVDDTKVSDINFDKVNLIYCGSPGSGTKDRLDLIVENIGSFSNLNLIVVGINEDQYKLNFLKNQIPSNVRFFGRVEHDVAVEYIKKAHFSIFFRNINLTNTAGFPTKFAESISLGTPVITNKTSNINDFFENNQIGYIIDNLNEKEIKAVLKKIDKIKVHDVILMKKITRQSKIFHFENYSDVMRDFLR